MDISTWSDNELGDAGGEASDVDANGKKKKRQGPFERLGLEPRFTKAVSRLGYRLPTPIQRKAIPAILTGRDVVAMARTGSGKTAAFVLPTLQRLEAHSTTVGIRCVILEPARELAFQVAKVVRQLSRWTDLRTCVLVGGAEMEKQFEELASNPDIVVAAPGRLVHHMAESELTLSAVVVLVLDEADQLFELGMAEQVSHILKSVNIKRQCILTSATLPSQLYEFSKAGLRSPEFIRLDVEDSISENLDMWFLCIRSEEKLACLVFLLRELLHLDRCNGSPSNHRRSIQSAVHPLSQLPLGTIVFVASRHHVEFLAALMEKTQVPTSVAYGSMDQQARVENLENFRKGRTEVLIVTDVAARGLDIPTVGTIINFDFPMSPKHFVHRVGRTARAGRPGLAISLVTLHELPYAVELLLFASLKVDLPPGVAVGVEDKKSALQLQSVVDLGTGKLPVAENLLSPDEYCSRQRRLPLYLGATPDLSYDVEFVQQCLERESALAVLHRSMLNSYIQYNKVRRHASKQSVRRAKELIDQFGGVAKVLSSVHPGLLEVAARRGLSRFDMERDKFLDQLRKVKPKALSGKLKSNKQTGVLSPEIVHKMQKKQLMSDLTRVCTNEPSQEDIDREVSSIQLRECNRNDIPENESHFLPTNAYEKPTLRTPPKNSPILHDDQVQLSVKDKIPESPKTNISMPQLRSLKKQGNPLEGSTTRVHLLEKSLAVKQDSDDYVFDIFDWKSQALKHSNFFLSSDRSAKDESILLKESHLAISNSANSIRSDGFQAMAEAQLNLIPDNETEQKKTKHVKKWDARRKRYVMTPVDSLGHALRIKEQKKRNEAGVIVRGELKKRGIYKKWVVSTKRRIQKVGELELVNVAGVKSNSNPSSKKNEHDDAVDRRLPELSTLTNDKALVEAIEKGVKLTHKQERKAKKLFKLQRNEITVGQKGDEIKNAKQLVKVKKDAFKRKAKRSRKMYAKLHRIGREKHMHKRALQNEMKAASRRSFAIPTNCKKTRR